MAGFAGREKIKYSGFKAVKILFEKNSLPIFASRSARNGISLKCLGGGIGRPAYRQAGAMVSNSSFEIVNKENALVAELVDALVSNTNEVTLVPVRLRPKVHCIKAPSIF